MADFTSNLKKVQDAAADGMRRAAEIIGGIAESKAKQYLTDQGAVDTGNLRNSVTHTTVEDGGEITVVIGSAVEYAPYIELGTGRNYEGSGGYGTFNGIKPRPYLRPAIENHREEYKKILEVELKNG